MINATIDRSVKIIIELIIDIDLIIINCIINTLINLMMSLILMLIIEDSLKVLIRRLDTDSTNIIIMMIRLIIINNGIKLRMTSIRIIGIRYLLKQRNFLL